MSAAGTNREQLDTDSLMGHLEQRVIALEAIVAAPFPLRIVAAWRLGRSIRCSIRHYPGDTFAQRRTEAVSNDWISTPRPPTAQVSGPRARTPVVASPVRAGQRRSWRHDPGRTSGSG